MEAQKAISVTFRFGAPLYLLHGAEIPVDQSEGQYTLKTVVVDSDGPTPFASVGGAKVTVPNDALGALHNTLATVTFPRPADITSTPGVIPRGVILATAVVNHVIDWYRYLAQIPRIRRVAPHEALWYRFVLETGAAGVMMNPTGMRPEGDPTSDVDGPNADLVCRLTEHSHAHQPKYRLLHLDALASRDAMDRRMTLIHLYTAFEMLLWMSYEAVGVGKLGQEEFDSSYAWRTRKPSVRTALKHINEWSPSPWSHKELRNRFNEFWTFRNEVMHGSTVEPSWQEVHEVVAGFETITPWLDRVMAEAGGPPPGAH